MEKQEVSGNSGKLLLYAFAGGILGTIVTLFLSSYFVNNRNYSMMNMMGMRAGALMMQDEEFDMGDMMEDMMHGEAGMSMDSMVSGLVALEGEEFDRRFIELMIEHHQGAIDMANLIPSRTDRQELKDLGNGIITAQTNEIEMMNFWLKTWFNETPQK